MNEIEKYNCVCTSVCLCKCAYIGARLCIHSYAYCTTAVFKGIRTKEASQPLSVGMELKNTHSVKVYFCIHRRMLMHSLTCILHYSITVLLRSITGPINRKKKEVVCPFFRRRNAYHM